MFLNLVIMLLLSFICQLAAVAGTMEGGRQVEVAKAILSSMNVPYVVAAPLLIQDLASWSEQGIQGLQVCIDRK